MRRTYIWLGLLISGGIILGGWYLSGYMPGTFYRDGNGFPRGTGWTEYRYDSGRVMLEEYYRAGDLRISRWYRPDRSLITETRWEDGNGLGLYLHQDGSIRAIYSHQDGLAVGVGWHFRPDGHPEKLLQFDEGIKIGEHLFEGE